MRIDINADLGEGFGRYRCGDDDALLRIVTSANVACGFHAGDPEIMAATFAAAKQREVSVGAHAGFPDLWGFGRRRIPFSAPEIERLVAYQIGAAQALANYSGHTITHVNAHGTLGNLSETEADVADAVARAIRAVDRDLCMLAIARSEQVRAAGRAGIRAFSQVYVDRAYTEQGTLVPRGQPGAVIEDAGAAAERVVAMLNAGALITVSGAELKTPIDSVCVHGDSPHAITMARTVRSALELSGVAIAPFGP
jgi:UPF0271 protein